MFKVKKCEERTGLENIINFKLKRSVAKDVTKILSKDVTKIHSKDVTKILSPRKTIHKYINQQSCSRQDSK